MAERERYGVRVGLPVRDLDGRDMGRVTVLYDSAFAVEKGFPILFRQVYVLGYDEVRGLRDGVLVVSRSLRALQELAAGELPDIWRIPVPPDFPAAATPPEARGVFEELAAERAQSIATGPPRPSQPPASGEREVEETYDESYPQPPAHTH